MAFGGGQQHPPPSTLTACQRPSWSSLRVCCHPQKPRHTFRIVDSLLGASKSGWDHQKVLGNGLGQETHWQLPSLPLESLAREAQVLYTSLPIGFSLPVGRRIKVGSPRVRCGWMVKNPGIGCYSSLSQAFGGLSLPAAGEEEGNWLPRAPSGSRWQKGRVGTEEMGGRAGGPGLDGISISSGSMFPLLEPWARFPSVFICGCLSFSAN